MQHQVEVAVAVDVDGRRRASVVFEVEAEQVGDVVEAVRVLISLVKQRVALEAAPGSAKLERQIGARWPALALNGFGIGDSLPPEDRSVLGGLAVLMGGEAVDDEQVLVAVVVHVEEQTAPGPASHVDLALDAALLPA